MTDPISSKGVNLVTDAEQTRRIEALERGRGGTVHIQTPEQREAQIEQEVQERVAMAIRRDDCPSGLTEAEIEALRAIAKLRPALDAMVTRDARVAWLWSTARAGAVWLTAIIVGWTVGIDALRAAIKRLAQ